MDLHNHGPRTKGHTHGDTNFFAPKDGAQVLQQQQAPDLESDVTGFVLTLRSCAQQYGSDLVTYELEIIFRTLFSLLCAPFRNFSVVTAKQNLGN